MANTIFSCCGESLKWTDISGEQWEEYVIERAECLKCNARFNRKKNGTILYIIQKDSSQARCRTCISGIIAGRVAHAIHDGPFPFSGSGKVRTEFVPYCPQCENKPPFDGKPITPITPLR